MAWEKHPHTPENGIPAIEAMIADYEQRIANLRFTLKMLKENPPPPVYFLPGNPKSLTRDLIRQFMSQLNGRSIQTVQVVDIFYPNADEKTKTKAIKTLSVVFNNLEKDGEVTKEKKKGIKGNFYTWAKK